MNEDVGTPTQAVMKERLQHLSVVEDAQAQTTPDYQRWLDMRLDRWLIDWTLRTGRERTAGKITAEKDIHVSHPQLIVLGLTDVPSRPLWMWTCLWISGG